MQQWRCTKTEQCTDDAAKELDQWQGFRDRRSAVATAPGAEKITENGHEVEWSDGRAAVHATGTAALGKRFLAPFGEAGNKAP